MTEAAPMQAAGARPGGVRPRILVVGAGVAGLEVVLGLAELAPGRAEVEVVSPQTHFGYRPLAIAETFGAGRPFRVELDKLISDAGAQLRRGEVVSVDPEQRVAITALGESLPYDLLVVASGARSEAAVSGVLTFRGEADKHAFRALLAELEAGEVTSLAFAIPAGANWPLPLYELALMTAAQLRHGGHSGVHLSLVTPEAKPLELFGSAASAFVADRLEAAGIDVHCDSYVAEATDEGLRLVPGGLLPAERAVMLPRLSGRRLAGLPSDTDGFIPVDPHGRVYGVESVYAAGDGTAFPVKQGGIAVEQAAAVAESLASALGTSIRPKPFRPVLRGLLLTGEAPRFLWADLGGGLGETSAVAAYPLWWPPGKIAEGRLARYLSDAGLPVSPPPGGPATMPIEVELPAQHDGRSRPRA